MNRRRHRLVFSRRLGMAVAVCEHARAPRQGAAGSSPGLSLVAAGVAALCLAPLPQAWSQAAAPVARPPVVFAGQLAAPSRPLPVPNSTAGRRFVYEPGKGSAAPDLRDAGRVTWSVDGRSAVFDQKNVDRVVVNWDSFDIGAGYSVEFKQNPDPTRYVAALNRIWSADPSLILGSLKANRDVILLNANGVYFGRGARVDAGSFAASANSIADAEFERGMRNVTDARAVFDASDASDYRAASPSAAVSVEAGAQIRSAAGGDVLLVAPRVTNQGRIETPGGQTVLAAGDKVYLMSSSDPAQRGLIVAVDPFLAGGVPDPTLGIVENSARGSFKTVDGQTVADATPDGTAGLVSRLNEIRADSGTVNLVGLAVRQSGVVNATTAVKGANGAIYLQAMSSTQTIGSGSADASSFPGRLGLRVEPGVSMRIARDLGSAELTAGSVTAVQASGSVATQFDAEVFNPSRIRVQANRIAVGEAARVEAPAGRVELLAASRMELGHPIFDLQPSALPADDGSGIVIAPSATLSVAGLGDVAVDGQRNQGTQRLFRIEVADAPVQRTGPLYRSEVFFDLREAGSIRAANVTGAAAGLGRTAAERSTNGGSLRLETLGTLVVGEGATLDVSGGSVAVSQAQLKNTLTERDGRLIAFSNTASATRLDAVAGTLLNKPAPAYTEGRAGGRLQLSARSVALAGNLAGAVVEGERQRNAVDARAAPAQFALGRVLNGNFQLADLQLQRAAVPALPPAVFAEPTTSALTGPGLASAGQATLSLASLQAAAFGTVELNATRVRQTERADLDLGPRGSLAVAAGSVALDGRYTAPGGSLSVRALTGDALLAPASALDTAGLWTNDGQPAGATPAPLQIDGGTVTVAAAGSVLLGPGAMLDVSAGASLSAAGRTALGRAGTLTVTTSGLADAGLQIDGASLRGFDFRSGGTLNLGTPGLGIGAASGAGFALSEDFFTSGGFGSIAISAFGDIRIAAGSALAPSLLNWQFGPDFRQAASGAMRAEVAVAQSVDTRLAERAPVNLSLTAARPYLPDDPLLSGGRLSIERGAEIRLDPAARLSLSATRAIDIGALGGTAGQATSITIPGGTVLAQITGVRGVAPGVSGDPIGFVPEQALWLGSDARIELGGTAVLRPATAPTFDTVALGASSPDDSLRQTGSVYGGGSLTLQANRGYVVVQEGASVRLDGKAAQVQLGGQSTPSMVARSAGTLTISTPEGFALEGTVSAQAPRDAQGRALADGGRLDIALGAGGVATNNEAPGRPYPGTVVDSTGRPIADAVPRPREIRLADPAPRVLGASAAPGDNLLARLDNGIGNVPPTWLLSSGFDTLRLASGDRVTAAGSLALAPALSLAFDTPAIVAVPGVVMTARSAYARLGDGVLQTSGRTPLDITPASDPSPAADTSLRIEAGTIDLVGQSALKGFASVTLDARATGGEIRLTGSALSTALTGSTAVDGSLAFAGKLTLGASQVYATSGAAFSIEGLAGDSQLQVLGTGSAPRTPLSAFGAFTAVADRIGQGGVLRQPFGTITLDARTRLSLGEHSLTSVSSDASVLYGSTDNLSRWLPPSTGQPTTQVPRSKSISLRSAGIDTAPSATVSAAGGGDVLAWEFFPGVGGSIDYLAGSGLYAVLPDYAGTRSLAAEGGRLTAGDGFEFVVTMAGSGLPPGRYALMPARQALLAGSLPQGAFIVSRAADQGRTVLSSPILRDDGSTVVTGYLSSAGSVARGTPGERFVVEPAATFAARSETRLTGISGFLDAQTAGAGVRGTPRDGGRVQVAAQGSSTAAWRAALDLSAGSGGGTAGTLDVSAARLALVVSAESPAVSGAFTLPASALSASGAASVLLGGLRSDATSAEGRISTIDSSLTQSVTVDLAPPVGGGVAAPAQPLRLAELILAARDRVEIAAGTDLGASGTAAPGRRTLQLSGEGAALVVSAGEPELRRSAAANSNGRLNLGAGSRLSGAQVQLDSAGTLSADNTLAVDAGALGVGARSLVLGTPAALAPGDSLIDGGLLAAVRGADDLVLRGSAGIAFAGLQDWARRSDGPGGNAAPATVLSRLILDSPQLRGVAATTGATVVDVAANEIQLRNTSGSAPPSATGGAGRLTVEALPPLRFGSTGGFGLGPGTMALDFPEAQLRSQGDLVLGGSGSLSASGDLSLASARLTAATGASQSIKAAGLLQVQTAAGSRSLGERVGQGAELSLAANRIVQAGQIDLPGATLSLVAAGVGLADGTPSLSFAPGSRTSVAGFVLPGHDGFEAYGQAGSLRATASAGALELGGVLDVSAATRADGSRGSGDAGQLRLSAVGSGGALQLGGSLLGRAGGADGDRGGSIAVDVASMADPNALVAAALSGGLDQAFDLRVRNGDVRLSGELRAARISVAADGGALALDGATLDARSASGGVVGLSARGDLSLTGGSRIDARSTRDGANGGDVLLQSSSARIRPGEGNIDARGDDAEDGRIVVRAARGTDGRSVAIDAFDPARLQAAEVTVEAVRVYDAITTGAVTAPITSLNTGTSRVTGSGAAAVGTLGQATLRVDNDAFMARAADVLSSLGVGASERGRVSVRPGVEVRTAADLTVAADWALNAERPGGQAGVLTLRAAGNLNVNGSLSDGFQSAAATAALLGAGASSWSMRLVAGADLAAASPTVVIDRSAGIVETGNLVIAGGRFVRTGAGSIDLAAGRDLRFGASGTLAPGSAYVAGRRDDDEAAVLSSLFAGQNAKPLLTEHGGRLSATAARDIVAPEATQLVNNWLWRSGNPSADPTEAGLFAPTSQLAWWSDFTRWRQTLGSMGGGDLRIQSGRHIENLQAMVPTTGWAGSRSIAGSALQVQNGGNLDVSADGDILGGQFLLGRGSGRLSAGGSVAPRTANTRLDGTALGLMDGHWRVVARNAVSLAAAFAPTALPAPSADARPGTSAFFYLWGEDAALDVRSAAAGVSLQTSGGSELAGFGLAVDPRPLARVMPPNLSVAAAGGGLALPALSALLYPSSTGGLSLWAGGDLSMGAGVSLTMADLDPASFPNPRNPLPNTRLNDLTGGGGLLAGVTAGTLPQGVLHADDPLPVDIHAEGSVRSTILRLAKPAHVSLGLDWLDSSLFGLHRSAADATRVDVGRDLLQSLIAPSLSVAGPGLLDIAAGRDIDLGASAGITTSGNLSAPTLPAGGASVRLRAGAAPTLDIAGFEAAYLNAGDALASPRAAAYREALRDHVRAELGRPDLDYAQALLLFRSFPASAQAAFGRQVAAAEFGAVYLAGAAPTATAISSSLQASFERRLAEVLAAGDAALAAGRPLVLPGRESLQGAGLAAFLSQMRGLTFSSIDVDAAVAEYAASLARVRQSWREHVASQFGSTASTLDAEAARDATSPASLAWVRALASFDGPAFDALRQQVLASELVSTLAAAASRYGRRALPMRLALFDLGFQALELGDLASFVEQEVWPARPSAFAYAGTLDLTQSSLVTQRGGDIGLLNPGGAINIGLKASTGRNARGVIAQGGGDVFGLARDDFQVNTQRVFIIGQGDMTVWSSAGDIDSGRGANTAVAAPPLQARRAATGILFETPATTTGSGLGILESASGERAGTIGLYPAFGEIRALDAFIRAPSIVLGSTVRGADNIQSPSVASTPPSVSPPVLSVAAPPAETRATEVAQTASAAQDRPRNSLLTVDLLGLGPTEEACSEQEERDGRCRRSARCTPAQLAAGECR